MSVRLFYDHWPQYHGRLLAAVRGLSVEQLAIRPAADHWPIWALAAHMAGTRVYWLCGVFGEPGGETTPFPDFREGIGWEDDETTPRNADELVMALESSWRIVERCLDTWTPEMLPEVFTRRVADGVQEHTRSSVLQRMLTHEAYHSGEISQSLGVHGLPPIDLWRPD